MVIITIQQLECAEIWLRILDCNCFTSCSSVYRIRFGYTSSDEVCLMSVLLLLIGSDNSSESYWRKEIFSMVVGVCEFSFLGSTLGGVLL